MTETAKFFPNAGHTHQTAHQELEALLQTLHESGTLRLLQGFFGGFSEVTEVLVKQMNEPAGRKLLGNLTVITKTLTQSEPKALDQVLSGAAQALDALAEVGRRRPPGLFSLFLHMRDPDIRRGLFAVMQVLRGIGMCVHRAADESDQRERLAHQSAAQLQRAAPAY